MGALAGAVVAALLLGLLGQRDTERDSVIGAILSFGLGVGVLLLWMNPERTSNKFSLLVGQIVGVDSADVTLLTSCAVVVLLVVAVLYRPLLFASVDPDVALARGVPTRVLSPVFALPRGATGLRQPVCLPSAGPSLPWPELWRGTGNQTERGMAQDLPLCVGCRRVLEDIARHHK